MKTRDIAVFFSILIAAALLSRDGHFHTAPQIVLEDSLAQGSPLRSIPRLPVLFESTLDHDEMSPLAGHRLSLEGHWSVQVGDLAGEFDKAFGLPVHATGWENEIRATYRVRDNLHCYVTVEPTNGRVAELRVYPANLMSMSLSPKTYLSPEELTQPGSWVKYHVQPNR